MWCMICSYGNVKCIFFYVYEGEGIEVIWGYLGWVVAYI